MKRLLLFSALALGVSGAWAQDTPLNTLDMSSGNWISKTDFKDYSDDTKVVFTFNATGYTDAVKNFGVGEIASAGQENKVTFCYVTKEGDNTAEMTVGQLKNALVGAENQDGLCWNMWYANACAIKRIKVEFFAVKKYGTPKNVSFDDYGNILASEFKGYSDDAQIKFTWTVTTTLGEQGRFNGWGLGAIKDIGCTAEGLELNKAAEGDNTLVTTLGDIKSLLAIEDQYGHCGLNWNVWPLSQGDDQVTAISVARKSCTIAEVATTALRPVGAGSEVVKTEYYNLAGVRSAEPTKGVNVVVRTMSDGTTQVDKQLVK